MPIRELEHKYSFRAALFIIAKKWKQTKCLSTNEWTKQNVVHPHGVLFSHKKPTDPCYTIDES